MVNKVAKRVVHITGNLKECIRNNAAMVTKQLYKRDYDVPFSDDLLYVISLEQVSVTARAIAVMDPMPDGILPPQ